MDEETTQGADKLAETLAARATEIHPEFDGPPEDFGRYLRTLDTSQTPLAEVRVGDLYLAWCCARGCRVALQHFWTAYVPGARRAAASVTKSEDLADDVMQEVLQKLIVGSDAVAPTLSSYLGRSKLERWLRSVAVRAALTAKRKNSQAQASQDDESLMQVPALDDDPQIALLKETSSEMVESALRESLRQLDSETRLVLQQHLVDGLTIDQLATIYRIHRATAARRVAKAREALLASTRQRLRASIQLTGGDLDSLINFAQSRIKLSLRWFAKTQGEYERNSDG